MGTLHFDDFELDLDAYTLKRGGVALTLQPKVFDVLRYLVERPGRLVTKSELLETLWAGEYVNESVIAWSVSHLRRALGQQRGDKHPIETVHARGYRFAAQVAEAATAPMLARPLPAHSTAGTLVGHQQAMAELAEGLTEAAAGRGGLYVVGGEAGIGKTRCLEELARRATTLGLQVLQGRCPREPGTPPLWPVASALNRAREAHPELAAEAQELMIGAEPRADDPRPPTGGAAFRTLERIAHLLRQLASRRPVLLTLDDLHWADPSSLRLLAFIAPELHSMPLCVVTTLRHSERAAGSASERLMLPLLQDARSIPLDALDVDQVGDLVEALAGRRPSAAMAQAIHRASGGVPLFVKEVARSLLWKHGEDELAATTPTRVRVPDLARDLLRDRLARLPADTAELLCRAAVIGESFDLSLLVGLLDLEPDVLLDRLDPAIAEGFVESDSPHAYRFAHSMFQSVVYDDLPHGRRAAIHREVASLLETRAQGTAHMGEVARHHYLSLPAGDHEVVCERALRAGHASMATRAFDEAALYFAWALEAQAFAPELEPRARGEVLRSLASAQRSAGRTAEAVETAARLIELAQDHRMHDLVVAATRLRRPSVAMASMPDRLARSALESVLRDVPEGPSAVRIDALAQLACTPPYEQDLSGSLTLSERALALAEQLGDREPMLQALGARLFALSGPDGVSEVLAAADRMLELDAQGPHSWLSNDARGARFVAFTLMGRMRDADAALDEMGRVLGDAHWGEAKFYYERLRVQRLFLDGHFDKAEQRFREVYPHALRAGVGYAEVFRQALELNLAVEREGPKAVARARLQTMEAAAHVPHRVRLTLARVAAEADELDAVRRQLAVVGDVDGYRRDGSYLNALASLAVCAAALDDETRCAQLRERLAPYAGLNTPDALGYYLGPVAYFLGILSAALGDAGEAERQLDAALAACETFGYPAGSVRAWLALGRLHSAAGRRARARHAFERAADAAQALGMGGALEDAGAALAS